MKNLRSKAWYPYAVAICIGVILYVVLTHLPDIIGAMNTFGRFFNTVVIGCIAAYLMNPLAMLYEKKLFRDLKKGKWIVSVILAFATVAAALAVLMITVIPQLVNSITAFLGNMFGIAGILLAIPVAAICDFTYREGVLPYLQARKKKKQEAAAE